MMGAGRKLIWLGLVAVGGCAATEGAAPTVRGTIAPAEGGALALGRAEVSFDPGDLSGTAPIEITMTETTEAGPDDLVSYSAVYSFEPSQDFVQPVRVCLPAPDAPSDATIYWSRASGAGFDPVDTVLIDGSACAQVTHFSEGFVGKPRDTSVLDAGIQDVTTPASKAAPDAGAPDSAEPDSARPDSALPDGPVPDSRVADGAVPDSRPADGAVPDGAMPDGSARDSALAVADGQPHGDGAQTSTCGSLSADGSYWCEATVSGATSYLLTSVWGSSSAELWAAGSTNGSSAVLRSTDGTNWSPVASLGADTGTLKAIWGTDERNVWTGGVGGSSLRHYTGSDWPLSGDDTGDIAALWGSGPSRIWAGVPSGLANYNGTAWYRLALSHSSGVKALWGSSQNDVWAAAGDRIYHYDGASWARQAPGQGAMHALWGTGPKDVWAVGEGGLVRRGGSGVRWTETSSGTTKTLRALWGSGTDRVWAAGDDGTLLHFNGDTWSAVDSGTKDDLLGIWGFAGSDASTDEVFVVGRNVILRRVVAR